MEWDPDNLKLLCVGCHIFWWHKEPLEAREWIEKVLPKERLNRLKLVTMSNTKIPFDYDLVKLYLEQEIKKLNKR